MEQGWPYGFYRTYPSFDKYYYRDYLHRFTRNVSLAIVTQEQHLLEPNFRLKNIWSKLRKLEYHHRKVSANPPSTYQDHGQLLHSFCVLNKPLLL